MTGEKILFEVEVRCYFESFEETHRILPFLHPCLQHHYSYRTTFRGLELFKSGRLLRTAEVVTDKDTRYFITWKGQDTGKFANIRQEINEEVTEGIANSFILRSLGSRESFNSYHSVLKELEQNGYSGFMSFEGTDFSGYYQPYDIKLKLMNCPILKWPFLLELEKTARTEEEATRCENELRELIHKLHLQDRLVKEEPPSLLYERLFSRE